MPSPNFAMIEPERLIRWRHNGRPAKRASRYAKFMLPTSTFRMIKAIKAGVSFPTFPSIDNVLVTFHSSNLIQSLCFNQLCLFRAEPPTTFSKQPVAGRKGVINERFILDEFTFSILFQTTGGSFILKKLQSESTCNSLALDIWMCLKLPHNLTTTDPAPEGGADIGPACTISNAQARTPLACPGA